MLEIALGSALMYYAAKEAFDIKPKPAEAVYYTETLDSRNDSFTRMHRETVQVKPAIIDQLGASSVKLTITVVALQP